jgi:hypothetical protein
MSNRHFCHFLMSSKLILTYSIHFGAIKWGGNKKETVKNHKGTREKTIPKSHITPSLIPLLQGWFRAQKHPSIHLAYYQSHYHVYFPLLASPCLFFPLFLPLYLHLSLQLYIIFEPWSKDSRNPLLMNIITLIKTVPAQLVMIHW